LPSGDTAIAEEECDPISNAGFVGEATGVLVPDGIVAEMVGLVESVSAISELFLQPTKPKVNINVITSMDLRYTAK
jgi:hypothetical protein